MFMFKEKENPLSYQEIYPCPVCRCGRLSNIALMDAFGCDVCRHIFTIHPEKQLLKMADREPSITWRWNGQSWQGEHIGNLELSWFYWLAALAIIIFPPTLIGLSAFLFPPVSGSVWAWFPIMWTVIAFLSHLFLVLWLIAEAYQFPVFLYLRTRWQQLRS
ncbi:hypothetical protein ACL6C3_07840 [Capilliphycus salinus ALCB114379]|uniref:hypothetical protein n=1 Tax=Capilliphycus salinus TaxID=2768948 RepID=UPI0039A629F2